MPAASPPPTETAARLVCAQVYGGTSSTSIPIELPGLEGYLFCRPCGTPVGGDIHYLSICGSGLLSRFCLADVVGHGEEVAIVSAETHALLRKSMNWTDHRRALRMLNETLARKGLESLTTAAMFTYYPPTRALTYSYAGHPRAWHWSAGDGAWTKLTVVAEAAAPDGAPSDLPLAVSADTQYTRGRLRPAVGDVIVLATDGLTDAPEAAPRDAGPARRLGEEGLRTLLESLIDHRPRAIVDTLVEGLASFVGTRDFTHDDLTVLALCIRPFSSLEAVKTILANRLRLRRR